MNLGCLHLCPLSLPAYLVLSDGRDGSSVPALLAAVRHGGGGRDVVPGLGRVGDIAAAVVLVEGLILCHAADAHEEALGELVHDDHTFSLWREARRE